MQAIASKRHRFFEGLDDSALFVLDKLRSVIFIEFANQGQVDYSFLVGMHRIRPSEFEDIKLRRTLSLEFEILNAVAGGEDNHSMLRYRFGIVDITRTMTPMVGSCCTRFSILLLAFAESLNGKYWPFNGRQDCSGA